VEHSVQRRDGLDRLFLYAFFARRRIGLACLPIPILIAFSRMYIGAHYLSDVVCAAAFGILCAWAIAHFLLRPIENRQSKIGRGGGEIRTHEAFRPSGFQDRRNQPLCHPSKYLIIGDLLLFLTFEIFLL
jgi:hypothetical protein